MTAGAVLLIAPGTASAESAPDLGRPFEPKPISRPLYGIKAPSEDAGRQQHRIRAADGVELFIETWLPKAKDGNVPPTRLPSIFVQTPYVYEGYIGAATRTAHRALVPRGYALSQMHVRGTGSSGGCLGLIGPNEIDDGARAIEYLGRDAPWSNGIVGGYGISYYGGNQIGTAGRGDPAKTRYLKALFILAPSISSYERWAFDGSVDLRGPDAGFRYEDTLNPNQGAGGFSHLLEKMTCQPENIEAAMDTSGDYTPFHEQRDQRSGVSRIRAATFMIHGHADDDREPLDQVGLYERLPASTPKAGMFGVFHHSVPDGSSETEVVRPEWRRPDFGDLVAAWFDRHLKGLPTSTESWPVAQVQGMDGQWRAEPEWPTTGGPVGHLGLGPNGALGVATPSGSTVYQEGLEEYERFPVVSGDAATFETPPLPGRLEITGQPILDTWVSLDRPDAHLSAKIETFDAAGNPIPWGFVLGQRSMRHLDPLYENRFVQRQGKETAINTPTRVLLRFSPTDLVVPKGGRLRVLLAGSANRGQHPNPAYGYDLPSGSFTRVTIHHDCTHTSALRFLTARPNADLLNVREGDEPAGPVADNRPYRPPVSDADGLAGARVCGRLPLRLDNFGPEIAYPGSAQGTCLARRSPIGSRNIGRIRLGYSRRRLLRVRVKPTRRTHRSYRYCVRRSRGRVSAVFSRRGRVALVATTARSHGNRGVRPGASVRALRRAYARRRAMGRGLYRANRHSPRLIGIRKGRVRFVAVANGRLLRNRGALRRHLRLAGL